MSAAHRIFGSELSPYSVKVRSFFRYKNLPHEWILRSPAVQAEFQGPGAYQPEHQAFRAQAA